MRSFRFWFEPNEKIPQFKKLCWDTIDVSLSDVLKTGIHPWQGDNTHRILDDKLVRILNSDELKPDELVEFNYCADILSNTRNQYYYNLRIRFIALLERIQDSVYFVDRLSYMELLRIVKNRLRKIWDHQIAHNLLRRSCGDFDSMRRLLKTKNKNIKLSGYNDIGNYDLGSILSLEDFESEDSIIISEVIGSYTFRLTRFLDIITDDQNRLKLTDSIHDFQLSYYSKNHHRSVLYNCHSDGDIIRFRPEISTETSLRTLAKTIAEQWRINEGKYCFDTGIDQVEKMLSQNSTIRFPSLNYTGENNKKSSSAKITQSGIKGYSVGRIISFRDSNETIKRILKNHGISMTGRKEQLFEKLAKLSADIYEEHKPFLDDYFSNRRFIKVESLPSGSSMDFSVLQDLDLRNMIISMYIIKHLRGNVILEASHNNDTFDLLSLAQSLIKGEVSLDGYFLQVG